MYFTSAAGYCLLVLVPASLFSSLYLYLYPLFHFCAFPSPNQDTRSAYLTSLRYHAPLLKPNLQNVAPFRLLVFGDPQLEGDSSIKHVEATTFPNLKKFWRDSRNHSIRQRVRLSLHDLIDFYLDDIPKAIGVWRKRLDHFGNDYYLAHIYRTLNWWTNPTHSAVLGDLVGSQWIDEEEFKQRGWRFWNRVFKGGIKVEDDLTLSNNPDGQKARILGEDSDAWRRRIINVAGNHDIGYAGDMSSERLARFKEVFGKANYELRFQLTNNTTSLPIDGQVRPVPEIRIVILNNLNLDTPAGSKELQDETYTFINSIIADSENVERLAHFTLLLTHVPLYKEAGICADGPFFSYFVDEYENGLKEQNQLTKHSSKGILEGIYGMSADPGAAGQGYGRNGVILNGHDHEGCDVFHFINQSASELPEWTCTKWDIARSNNILHQSGIPGLREVTVRSMMGNFRGNAGLLSVWFNEDTWTWNSEFLNCELGPQHIWWVTHILDIVTICVILLYNALVRYEKRFPRQSDRSMSRKKARKATNMPKDKHGKS
ncbi:hypothetical protein BGHDH14_bgh01667 [Blumeria hordei DH14]|uniref:Protein TED1 n=1 Tax=Blumeria graminis f. sp. hordei (strain DH14) TaxID=546991 RepID=N1JQA0_BLUG1|nr:hypothetical protein BGHDH14_bgh01667 [Blumeria hordei DH14]